MSGKVILSFGFLEPIPLLRAPKNYQDLLQSIKITFPEISEFQTELTYSDLEIPIRNDNDLKEAYNNFIINNEDLVVKISISQQDNLIMNIAKALKQNIIKDNQLMSSIQGSINSEYNDSSIINLVQSIIIGKPISKANSNPSPS